MKTSELTGVALDWSVAKCEGHTKDVEEQGWTWHPQAYQPSTNWSHGGPIIEREGIELWCSLLGQPNHNDPAWQTSHWRAKYYNRGVGDNVLFDGKTPLEAAMRCYVASKLGEEVDVPNELIGE